MPNLGPQRGNRTTNFPSADGARHRCARCREELHLVRRHVSPPRLGAPLATEFYECGACNACYALNLATGKWKPWVGDED